jgi:hypothetical protein
VWLVSGEEVRVSPKALGEIMPRQTQKERKQLVRELIDRQPYNRLFDAADVEAMNDLCGWNFLKYVRIHNPAYPTDTRCVAHADYDKNFVVWSWNRAISGGPILNQALRRAIQPHMRLNATGSPDFCAHCKSQDFLTLDHMTMPFSVIVAEFIKHHSGVFERLGNKEDGGGWYIADPVLEEAWVDFHAQNADYQVLCRSCNASKGVKNAVQKSR